MKILTIEPAQKAAPQAFFPCMLAVESNSVERLQALLPPLYNVQHVEGIVIVTGSRELFDFCSDHSLHAVLETRDPLSNIYTAAKAFDLEVVVRIRDHIEAEALDRALFYFRSHFDELDYVKTADSAFEIIRFDALEEAFYHSKERVDFAQYLIEHFRAAELTW